MSKYPILMYHRVVSQRCPVPRGDREELRYAIVLDEFERQLDRLCELRLTGVSMRRIDSLASGEHVPDDWVAITFDDGNESDYVHALPMLAERGFDATFFVCGCRIDAPGGLERGVIGAMAGAGMHIGAHGMTHRFLTTLDDATEYDELVRSRGLLGAIIGDAVDHFAPPGGRYDARTLGALRRAGFRAVCTSDLGYNDCAARGFAFKRFPVTTETSPRRFDAIVARSTVSLLPWFARARALHAAKVLLGETAYHKLRGLGMGR